MFDNPFYFLLNDRVLGDPADLFPASGKPKWRLEERFFVDSFFIVFPKNIDEALEKLLPVLTRTEKTKIVNMDESELVTLMPSLGLYIRGEYRLWGNDPLIDDCKKFAKKNGLATDDPAMVIIWALWKHLQGAGLLKIVK